VIKRILMLSILLTGTLVAQEAKVTPLLSKDLTGIPGKECLMITVDYAPGATDAIRRHNAHVFVYVLEGSVVMQVRGGKEVILVPGQAFYEGPQDVHVVGRNASKTTPAKFLVFFVKDKGAPTLIPLTRRPQLNENTSNFSMFNAPSGRFCCTLRRDNGGYALPQPKDA
jgi:quercetin dioxygenase-like cupin family protein